MQLRFATMIVLVASFGFSFSRASETGDGAPSPEAFTPALDSQQVRPLPPVEPTAAAGGLAHASRCHPEIRRAALIDLRWKAPAGEGLVGQRVDISKFRDGFATGSFETTRRLPVALEAVSVEAPEPGVNYYWRVLTETAEGWITSPVERFEVPICPSDAKEYAEPGTPGSPFGAAPPAPKADGASADDSPTEKEGGR